MSTVSEEPKEVVVGSPEREIHVKPLVSLEKVQLKSEEDNECEIYKMRAKLYRYFIDEEDGPTWKERGIGDVRILKHNTTGLYRILMRRDKTLKLCANHAITSTMVLKPHASSDRAFVWSTPSDFADGEAKAETLCIKFGKPESAKEFLHKFEECITSLKNINDTSASDEKSVKDSNADDKLAKDLSSLTVNGNKDESDVVSVNKSEKSDDSADTKNENTKNTNEDSNQEETTNKE